MFDFSSYFRYVLSIEFCLSHYINSLQAKFLKACGTLAGTPVEIRKASEKLKVSASCDKDSEPSRFHSWLPSTSVEKLQLDVQLFNPTTPIKLCQELGDRTDSFERTPNRLFMSLNFLLLLFFNANEFEQEK